MSSDKKKYCYEYPRPAMTADCVIFGFDGEALRILLVERGVEPYKGYWALPGGFMKEDESIEECAMRELLEETGMRRVYLEQCHTFSSPGRDPRGRVVTVAFIALVRPGDHQLCAGDDAVRATWFEASMLPPLAFDHREIIAYAREYLKEVLRLRPVAFRLLDEIFTMDDLRRVYEVINDTVYDRRNFERKALQSKLLAPDLGSSYEDACCASEESCTTSRRRRGRFPRLFSFSDRPTRGKEDDDEREGSIKDLFNF
ncbi:MAG: NUDIX hydrolase [Muribaculaceae bacterium]|nr:NUDIX hydrolase [Muribaculaceae bacterium]